MAKNFKSGIIASAIAVTIATAGITTVSSFTLVTEAQAWTHKKAKRVAKRKYKKAKRKVINVKNIVAGNRCKGGSWINGRGLCGMSVDPYNGTKRTIKRKLKYVTDRLPNGRIGDPVRGTKNTRFMRVRSRR